MKDKRSILKRLLSTIQKKYHVSVIEGNYKDTLNYSLIAIAVVSNEYQYMQTVFQNISNDIDEMDNVELQSRNLEVL